jgi:dihydroflavonol-4-reductase
MLQQNVLFLALRTKLTLRYLIKSLFTGKDPLLTKETAATAMTKAYFDNTKLKKFLPEFKYRKIEDTVIDTCAALQQKINNG